MSVIKNKKWITEVIVVIFVFSSVILFFLDVKIPKKGSIDDSRSKLEILNESAQLYFSDKVVISDSEKIQKIDLLSGEIEPVTAVEQEDFSSFSGLPELGINGNEYFEKSNSLLSLKEDKVLVEISVYSIGLENLEFVDPDSIIRIEEFVCDVAKAKCENSDLLSRQYQGLENSIQKDPSFVWSGWDSQKNLLFGNLQSNENEAASLIYVCDVEKKICAADEKRDFVNYAPSGLFSPRFDKVVIVSGSEVDGAISIKRDLVLYETADLSKPVRYYDISSAFGNDKDASHDSVQSVAWSKDEKHLAIGTSRRIFVLDLERNSLSLAYLAPNDDENDYYWDYSSLFLSSDAKFIAFVDSVDWIEDELSDLDAEETMNTLKKIELENKKVIQLYSGLGLSLE
ncbi:MAG: hypothetical protein US63_C0045G0003 [Candidatus Moranbacteria bacterium GW2011_GWC2_37_8]|nr:MAG: hypothetical protein US63_C0045G0003 [Candidatus Moranbacteria bacterium GW2011_GWC2_37_8]